MTLTRSSRTSVVGWGLAAPAIVLFGIFGVYPMLAGVGYAFVRFKGLDMTFVGLGNFRDLGRAFPYALRNTLLFIALIVPVIVVVPMILALMSRGIPRTAQLLRIALYLPAMSTAVLMAIVWRWIFAPSSGFLNWALSLVGIAPVLWLAGIPEAFVACCIVLIPLNLGGNLILMTVGVQNIPDVLYDMSAMDGCTILQRAWYVTLPAILPTIGLVALLTTMGMCKVWMVPHMLTGGGPIYSTTTLVMDLYNNAFVYGRFGRAAAEGLILMGITASLALVQARFVWRVI